MEPEQTTNLDAVQINFSLDDIIFRNPNFKMMEIDDELACVDETNGGYVGLNETGKMILEMLDEPLSVSAIIDQMIDAFPEDKEQVVNDVATFIGNLLSLSVITHMPH